MSVEDSSNLLQIRISPQIAPSIESNLLIFLDLIRQGNLDANNYSESCNN